MFSICNNIFQRSNTGNHLQTQIRSRRKEKWLNKNTATNKTRDINCPLCPVRVSSDTCLLGHFTTKHVTCKVGPQKDSPASSGPRKAAIQRIPHLFNKYSHTRKNHRAWLLLVGPIGKVCVDNCTHWTHFIAPLTVLFPLVIIINICYSGQC